MVKEFSYTSNKGTRDRKIFVIKETDHYLEGIDLTLLTQEDADFITSKYKDFKPLTSRDEKITLEEFNPIWNKAYRQFSKSKIR
jgi:hypothetical protein